MSHASLTLLLLAFGCTPKKIKTADYEAPPRLPSPIAGTYARTAGTPPDPVIAALTKHQRWDASLGGAASGLALQAVRDRGTGLEPWEVREAAWRAGYPYPIDTIRGWTTPIAAEPEGLRTWLAQVPTEHDLGLVRARGDQAEAWVALVAKPRGSIGVQPRQIARGDSLTLPAVAGAQYVVCDPNGAVVQGALDVAQDFTMDIDGEWLFEIDDADGRVALFPVYVGMMPPEIGLLEWGPAATTSDEATARVSTLLADIRGAYGASPWLPDLFLDQAAQTLLTDASKSTDSIASALGYPAEKFWRWECTAHSVEACLDQNLWDPHARPALLTDTQFLGLGTEVRSGAVHVVALIAGD